MKVLGGKQQIFATECGRGVQDGLRLAVCSILSRRFWDDEKLVVRLARIKDRGVLQYLVEIATLCETMDGFLLELGKLSNRSSRICGYKDPRGVIRRWDSLATLPSNVCKPRFALPTAYRPVQQIK